MIQSWIRVNGNLHQHRAISSDLSIFTQLDHPVALTPPLILDDQVLIGLYCDLTGSACIHIDIDEFIDLKHFLYDPQWFRLLVHGIKRIWENHEIGTLDTLHRFDR